MFKVQEVKIMLNRNFCMKDLGVVSQYLGVDVQQNLSQGYTELNQTDYLKNILNKFGMQDYNPIHTPLEPNIDLSSLKSDFNDVDMQKLCRQIIGSLMYAVSGTRPDLCESVSLLSQFQDKANENLYEALKRILRYVKATVNMSLVFKFDHNQNILQGYVDSDWGGDTLDRKSTTGYVFKMFGCTISWCSRKQQNVSISSTESEFVALSLGVSEACWLRKILVDFDFQIDEPVVLYEDNMSAIFIANNPENNKRLKHVDVKYFFVKEKIDLGMVKIIHVKTENQLADMFTKPLSRVKFEKFREELGVRINSE